MKNLAMYRKRAGLTQYELGKAINGSGQSIISNYEKGDRNPSITQAMKIIKVLQEHNIECSIEELFGIETQKAS